MVKPGHVAKSAHFVVVEPGAEETGEAGVFGTHPGIVTAPDVLKEEIYLAQGIPGPVSVFGRHESGTAEFWSESALDNNIGPLVEYRRSGRKNAVEPVGIETALGLILEEILNREGIFGFLHQKT